MPTPNTQRPSNNTPVFLISDLCHITSHEATTTTKDEVTPQQQPPSIWLQLLTIWKHTTSQRPNDHQTHTKALLESLITYICNI